MARVPPILAHQVPPELAEEYQRVVAEHGVVTNMKATLLHSPVALHAVLQWYALFERIKPVLGQRLAVLFCQAISHENRCELCYTFMRRAILNGGEDPEHLALGTDEQDVVDFGRQLARDPNRIPEDLFQRLSARFSPAEIVDLTVFGALMIVNNVFNSALQIDVDGELDAYRIQPEIAFA